LFEEDSESDSENKEVKDSIALGRDEEGDDTPNPLQVINSYCQIDYKFQTFLIVNHLFLNNYIIADN